MEDDGECEVEVAIRSLLLSEGRRHCCCRAGRAQRRRGARNEGGGEEEGGGAPAAEREDAERALAAVGVVGARDALRRAVVRRARDTPAAGAAAGAC